LRKNLHYITISPKKKKKNQKKQIPIHFFQTPHPTPPKELFVGKLKKDPIFLFQKTTKLFLPMPPKNQPFGLIPIPKKIHLSQSLKRNLIWKGVELPHPPFLTQKKPC
jgi:hypothetical protein